MDSITLTYTIENPETEEVEVKNFTAKFYTVACGKRRTSVLAADLELKRASLRLKKEYPDVIDWLNADAADRAEYDLELQVRHTEFNMQSQIVSDLYYYSIAQGMINTDHLTYKEKKMVESPVTGDFWQRQNIEEVEQWVSRFSANTEAAGSENRNDQTEVENLPNAEAGNVGGIEEDADSI